MKKLLLATALLAVSLSANATQQIGWDGIVQYYINANNVGQDQYVVTDEQGLGVHIIDGQAQDINCNSICQLPPLPSNEYLREVDLTCTMNSQPGGGVIKTIIDCGSPGSTCEPYQASGECGDLRVYMNQGNTAFTLEEYPSSKKN